MKCKKIFFNLSKENKIKLLAKLSSKDIKEIFSKEKDEDIINFIINKLELDPFK